MDQNCIPASKHSDNLNLETVNLVSDFHLSTINWNYSITHILIALCFIAQEAEIVNLKRKIENLKECIAEKEDKELTKLQTENLKLKYQINHLEKVKYVNFTVFW